MTTLHLVQASLEAFDTNPQVTADIEAALTIGADAIGFTEVTRKGHRDELTAAARRHNHIIQGGDGDTAVAIPRHHTFIRGGSRLACTGGRDEFGTYGPRYIDWATVDMYGETVTILEAHWPRPKNTERRIKHKALTESAIRLIQAKSEGAALAFLLGDLNEDDEPGASARAAAQFKAAGITSIYDELAYYPATGPGGGTIDLIASANRDTRVSAAGAYAWPRGHSDHHRVSAFYTVRAGA